MPITEAERKKLRKHTFSEDKKDQFGWTHSIAPELPVGNTIKNAVQMLFSSPWPWILNAAGSIILAVYLFKIFESVTIFDSFLYTAIFFVLEILIVAPLNAFSKASYAGIGRKGVLRPMLMSLTYLAPLVPIFYITALILLIHIITTMSVLAVIAFLLVMVIAILLHITNLNASLSIHIMYDKEFDRTTSLNKSWMALSGQSLSMMAVNITAFVPLIISVIAEAVLVKNVPIWYVVPVIFIISEFCISLWQASTSYAYKTLLKNVKSMQYSRL